MHEAVRLVDARTILRGIAVATATVAATAVGGPVAGAEVATQTARGFEFTAVGGFVMNQTTNSQTFTIASTENAIVGGPIALSGTITVEGSLAVV